eukprot:TRINITY_DN65042_c0_g1_i3.p1 TRINITY_DN65042_c0_g1~~TRINITY_DN65042_c0_g1_i3.p1  ORF type:complete len:292 (+),score=30.54 TRINITY_DN65042_c0_g1_i3:59-934(+)
MSNNKSDWEEKLQIYWDVLENETTGDIEDIWQSFVAGFDEATPRRTHVYLNSNPPRYRATYGKREPLLQLAAESSPSNPKHCGQFSKIPAEVAAIMLEFLTVYEVLHSVLPVCHTCLHWTMEDSLWRCLLVTHYGRPGQPPPANQHTSTRNRMSLFVRPPATTKAESEHIAKLVSHFKGRHFFTLFKRHHVNKRNSSFPVKWEFRCPLSWVDLTPTDDVHVRHCSGCDCTVRDYGRWDLKANPTTDKHTSSSGCVHFVAVDWNDVGPIPQVASFTGRPAEPENAPVLLFGR